MAYINHYAANLYLGVCRESFFLGIIGYDTFLARMCALREMCNPEGTHWKYTDRLLRIEQWEKNHRWDAETKPDLDSFGEGGNQNETRAIWLHHDRDDGEIILQFIPEHATGLGAWVFHKGDADPFPSIPHAHQLSNDKRKLDAFLGWVYLTGVPDGREKRESIIRLWNDKKFRIFAAVAIQHFIQQNPHRQWRVSHPYRLPRTRR